MHFVHRQQESNDAFHARFKTRRDGELPAPLRASRVSELRTGIVPGGTLAPLRGVRLKAQNLLLPSDGFSVRNVGPKFRTEI